jgi:hypothetical protein
MPSHEYIDEISVHDQVSFGNKIDAILGSHRYFLQGLLLRTLDADSIADEIGSLAEGRDHPSSVWVLADINRRYSCW